MYYNETVLSSQNSEADEDDRHYHLRRAVKALPPEQAEVLLLRIWEEQTFASIARSLSQPESTVRSRYRAALLAVRRMMNPLTVKTEL